MSTDIERAISSRDEFSATQKKTGIARITWENHIYPVAKALGLVIVTIWCVTPMYYSFANSLKTPGQVMTEPMGIPFVTFDPAKFVWGGGHIGGANNMAWATMWQAFPFPEYLLATFVVSFGTAGLATILAIFASYAFARLTFPHKEKLFVLAVFGFMFPRALIAIPIFVQMNRVGLINTYLGLIFAFAAFVLPYTIWLLRGFFEDLPENLEESARVDGCTHWGAFYRVILPISRPALASVFMLGFLLAWHQFLIAFIMANDVIHTTLPPGILQMQSQFFVRNIHYIMAGAFLTMIVPVALYMYLQKYLLEGLTAGTGVKG